ncbi:hypothetical protein BCR42DRAFT_455092 [Absidia repens]|uniref:Rho-GAP domain-containing protein n=1 Tax=Absidia repens TaxID=90262 RepID=A0A1X2I4I0_9FUNG|nr:hypothetical protein BCR42DRAFT_455092 [Absidia repens]
MSYSFDFGAEVTRICMDEIRRRGLDERKILRKSAPNSILLLKVFRQQNCTADDLVPVSIHSVATLMQDTLWCCQERIVPKKVWKIINYETCTLPDLSKVLTKKGEALLIEILDFLVELMQHKTNNLMDAYHLGEAMGKVTLGPADCDPIIGEKAGHFMTRMIIEHSKWMTQTKRPHQNRLRLSAPATLSSPTTAILPPSSSSSTTPSSPSSSSSSSSCPSTDVSSASSSSLHLLPTSFATYQEGPLKPMSKTEAAKAKAKSYNRLIQRIKNFNVDWIDYANVGLYALMEDDYELEPVPKDEPWISIFAPQLDPNDANASPLLYRIISQATLEEPPVPSDPFASSYWFQHRHSHPLLQTNQNGDAAFSEFASLIQSLKNKQLHQRHPNGIDGQSNSVQGQEKEKSSKSQLKKINHSLANIKVNLRKRHPNMDDGSGFSGSDFSVTDIDSGIQHHEHQQQHIHPQQKRLPPSPQELDQTEELTQQQQQRHKKLPSLSLIQNQSVPSLQQEEKQPEQPSTNQQQHHLQPIKPQQDRQMPQIPATINGIQHRHDDNYSTKDQLFILNGNSKHSQVKNLMRRMIKIGNTNSGSSIKKSHSHIVY